MIRLLILTALLSFSSVGNSDENTAINPARYYAQVDTIEDANQIAQNINAELVSYVDGIAVYSLNRPVKRLLYSMSIDTYESEQTTTLDDNNEVTLSRDSVYYPDGLMEGSQPSGNALFQQETFKSIDWEYTYRNGITGQGAVVAVIDTGCNITHEDLKGNIIGCYNSLDGSDNVTDTYGHGTHVAGIIAADDNAVGNVGVAPDAKLYIIKASTHSGDREYFYTSDIIKGLNKCVDLGYVNVVNMSLGGGGYESNFKAAIENCLNHGITVCVSAGNDGSSEVHYPSGYGLGLLSASYEAKGHTLSSFSNYGVNANIAAPGSFIWSTYNKNDSSYVVLSGTSMASPFTAGVAALVYSNKNIPKTRSGANSVISTVLNARDSRTYSFGTHSVKGGLNVQNIFHCNYVQTPVAPRIEVKTEKQTGQAIVSISSDYDVIYTTDGTAPGFNHGEKYSGVFNIDAPGKYKLRAVTVNKHAMSVISKDKAVVPDDVVSNYQIENYYLTYDNKKSIVRNASIQILAAVPNNTFIYSDRLDWKIKKGNATINSKGIVTIGSSVKSGDVIKVVGKIGGVKRKIKLTIK